jgi:hypothetical protein
VACVVEEPADKKCKKQPPILPFVQDDNLLVQRIVASEYKKIHAKETEGMI